MAIISSKLCGSGQGINPSIIIPSQSFEVREGKDIDVVFTKEGSKDVWTVHSNPLAPATANISITPSEAEVGDTIADVEFKITINEGSESIASIVSDPDVGTISVGVEKVFNVSNVNRDTIGDAAIHTITVTDVASNVFIFTLGVSFKARIFQGFTSELEPDEVTIEALQDISSSNGRIADSVLSLYQGEKTYLVPAGGIPKYIHWWYPVLTVGVGDISGLTLNGVTPVPYVAGSNINITNAHGILLEYVHKRTSQAFGNTSFNITMD